MQHITEIKGKLVELRQAIGAKVTGWERLVPQLATYNAALKTEDYIVQGTVGGVGQSHTFEPTDTTRIVLNCIVSGLTAGQNVGIKIECSADGIDWWEVTPEVQVMDKNETYVYVMEHLVCTKVRCKWVSGSGVSSLPVKWMS